MAKSDDLTHLNPEGEVHIVNVGEKAGTRRVAVAEGWIEMAPATLERLIAGDLKKGDALGAARIAGLMACKRTWELIPSAIPLPSPTPRWSLPRIVTATPCTVRRAPRPWSEPGWRWRP